MEIVGQGDMPGTVEMIPWFELGYEHEGVHWKQRFYCLPGDSESIYVLRAQASVDVADTVFEAADLVASSFRPAT